MVGHTEISISMPPGCFGHDLKGVGPIGSVGMRMKDAANVSISYGGR